MAQKPAYAVVPLDHGLEPLPYTKSIVLNQISTTFEILCIAVLSPYSKLTTISLTLSDLDVTLISEPHSILLYIRQTIAYCTIDLKYKNTQNDIAMHAVSNLIMIH